MAGFGRKGKRDAPKGSIDRAIEHDRAVGLIARGNRAVPVTVQACTRLLPAPGSTSSSRSSCACARRCPGARRHRSALRISERRSKLLGLDAPTEHRITTLDALDAQIAELEAQMAANDEATSCD
jgi:hypothetical protein